MNIEKYLFDNANIKTYSDFRRFKNSFREMYKQLEYYSKTEKNPETEEAVETVNLSGNKTFLTDVPYRKIKEYERTYGIKLKKSQYNKETKTASVWVPEEHADKFETTEMDRKSYNANQYKNRKRRAGGDYEAEPPIINPDDIIVYIPAELENDNYER